MKGLCSNYLYEHVSYNALATAEFLEQYLEGKVKGKPVFMKQLAEILEDCVVLSGEKKEVRLLDDLSKEILRECLSTYVKRKLDDTELVKQIFNVSLDLKDFEGFRNHEISQLIKFCKELGEKSSLYFTYRK